jgi:acetyl-CoA carboxylase carboxyl transferase subunit alpha
MHEFGLIDDIIKEPVGGAHSNPEEMAKLLKRQIKKSIAELLDMDPDERIEQRINKYANIGVYDVMANDEVIEE